MDELRKDVRALFERRQAGLGEIRGSRETVMRRALAKKDEPLGGRLNFAAGIAAVLIAALVVATFAYVRGHAVGHEGPPPGASSSRLATPVATPSRVSESPRTAAQGVIVDADLVGASTGWVLLTNCIQPMTGQCHYSVASTTNGGGTWSKAVQVGPLFDPTNGDAPRHVQFINPQDGFVYGGVVAYVTHDAGQTWTSVTVNRMFVSVVTGLGKEAWLITYPCAKGVNCPFEVRSSATAGRTWSSAYSLPLNFNPDVAIPFGTEGLLISSETSGDMELTQDGGTTWTFIKTRCTANNLIAKAATADGIELWELCLDYPNLGGGNVSTKVLFVSEDGGKAWSKRETEQVSGPVVASGYSMELVSSRRGSAIMVSSQTTTTITHDTGRTWVPIAPADLRIVAIRFGTGFDGWALDIFQNIWFTHDGGDGWKELTGLNKVAP